MPAALIVAGIACICTATGGWGWLIARQLRRRPAELAAVQAALQALRTEIEYASTPLPDALRRAATAARGPAAALCRLAARHLEAGAGASAADAWSVALDQTDALSSWDTSDLAVLGQLGTALGASGTADQVRHIALCVGRLRAAEAEARGGAERQARMWLYLGVLAGAALVLVTL